ncbi:MAG: glycoside hydrolase family 2, partial [Atopobiaceae bacterium]|nr:glycoside hydrolase family 2 [Atopobiaceae bacterium]
MDLDIRRVIKSIPKDYGPEELRPLTTEWGEALGEVAYRSHPRPLLARAAWQTLDGWWECAFVPCGDA